jgi:hypothetical protein
LEKGFKRKKTTKRGLQEGYQLEKCLKHQNVKIIEVCKQVIRWKTV